MKSTPLTLLMALGILISGITQGQSIQKSSHAVSFEKSILSDTLDAIQYTIYLKQINFTSQEITAQTDVLLSSKIDGLDHVTLELQDLTVDSVFIGGTKITNFSQAGYFLYMPLQSSINSGEMVTVSVFYHGHPFHEDWGGFHWSGDYCFNLGVGFVSIPHNLGKTWFPCIDDFHDRAIYELFVTVDQGKDAVCGGLLQDISNNGNGTLTYHWLLNQTIPTYLASVAVGDYARWTGTYNGIEGDIPIGIWVKPQDSIKVDGTFQNLNAILALYEEKFGPYPFDRVGYTGTAIGAMEHATNIFIPHTMVTGGTSYESYVAHELSHMWFGDNVTCASAEDMWLNEGWATFCDALYQEYIYSEEQYKQFIIDKHKTVIQYCHTSGGDGSYFPINQIPQEVTYGMSAYDRGATIAYSLRYYLGDDLFFSGLTAYNETFQLNYASSEDLRDVLTSTTGTDLTDWFDNWVFHSGTPNYTVDSFNVVQTGSGADVTVFMKQKRHGPEFTGNSNKVELTFMDNDWNQYSEDIIFDGQTGNSVFQVPFVPDFIIPDLDNKQCDATTDFSAVIKQTGSQDFTTTYFSMDVQSVTDSAFVWVGHEWAPPDPLKTPVQGLTISDYRYWKIKGNMPAGFDATGIFWYNKNNFLDNGIITSSSDSVIIMYRPSPAFDWQFIDFTTVGLWSIGKLYVEHVQPGEYTIAVCDDTFVGKKENRIKTGFNVYPNPSGSDFRIDTGQPGTLFFYDIQGHLVDHLKIRKDDKTVSWNPGLLNPGTYIVKYNSENNNTIAVERLIVTN